MLGKLIVKAATEMHIEVYRWGFQEVWAKESAMEDPEDNEIIAFPPCIGPAHPEAKWTEFPKIMALGVNWKPILCCH